MSGMLTYLFYLLSKPIIPILHFQPAKVRLLFHLCKKNVIFYAETHKNALSWMVFYEVVVRCGS